MSWVRTRFLAYGFLLGTAGVKILSSRDAKTAYTHVTAAVMRGADDVMKTCETLKENCQDIGADARAINEKRAEEEEARQITDAKALLESAKAEKKN